MPTRTTRGPAATGTNGVDWEFWFTVIGTTAAVISAAAVIVVFVYWIYTRSRRARRDEQQAEMAENIEQLQNVVAILAEEARSRRPQPRVRFATADGPSDAIAFRRTPHRLIDEEAIINREADEALATLLPVEPETPRSILGGFSSYYGRYRNITEQDHADFREDVEKYRRSLRTFLKNWASYRDLLQPLVVLTGYVENDGGAPADDARVRFHFPDPFRKGEWPERPRRPKRPKFERPENPLSLAFVHRTPRIPPIHVPRLEPENRIGPFYDEGSATVRFNFESVPHADPFKTPPFVVACAAPGTYTIAWTVHAANLPAPERGEVHLTIEDEPPHDNPITTLAELLQERRYDNS